MAESGAVLPNDSTGKALRTNTQTTAFTSGQGGVVHQQVIALGDPETVGQLAQVSAAGELATLPTFPALTKGAQSATGLTVQRLQDAGRTAFSAYNATAHAITTAAALVSLTPNRGGTTGTAATSLAVTAGKTLRIMGVTVTLNATAATAVNANITLRMSATGAVTTTSPPIGGTSIPPTAATANVPQQGVQFTYADGFELSGTQQFGVTANGSTAGGALWVVVYGYEY